MSHFGSGIKCPARLGPAQFVVGDVLEFYFNYVTSDGAGHVDIVRDVSVISLALMRLKERLDLYGRNLAPSAWVNASSTRCDDGLCHSA